ncbi:MAG: UbiD family decarboxylase [Thermocladium sp.]|jgi:UbiD family decarboxylase
MSLRLFLTDLEKKGLLASEGELSPEYEAPYVISAKSRQGPALVFRLRGFPGFMGIGNILDTRDKLRMALNASSDAELYEKLINAENSPMKPATTSDAAFRPLPEVDLRKLPIPRFFEKEITNCLTSGVVLGLGTYINASIHRLSVIDNDKFVIRLVPRNLYSIHQENKAKNKDTPIAIVWGAHPAFLLASASSPPFGVSELEVAARLLDYKVFQLNNGLLVPSEAEIVMEGYISKDYEADEGPCVDIMGTYDIIRKQPIVKITRVYVREEPIYSHILVAGSPENSILMGFEKEARIWSSVRGVADVKSVRLTPGGGGWLHAVVSIKKKIEGEGKNAILAAFAAHPSLKHVVIVDDDIDPDDPMQVEWAIATRFRGDKDLVMVTNVRGSSLDPVAIDQAIGLTTKVGIDATKPLGSNQTKFERAKIPRNK